MICVMCCGGKVKEEKLTRSLRLLQRRIPLFAPKFLFSLPAQSLHHLPFLCCPAEKTLVNLNRLCPSTASTSAVLLCPLSTPRSLTRQTADVDTDADADESASKKNCIACLENKEMIGAMETMKMKMKTRRMPSVWIVFLNCENFVCRLEEVATKAE